MFKGFLPTSIKGLKLSKRGKFIFSALFLSFGFLILQMTNISYRYEAVAFLTVASGVLTIWSLIGGLNGVEWLTVLILPVYFTAGVGLFFFLIPSYPVAKFFVISLYGLGFYVLLLTENIFSVAAIRTIQLFRSAMAVGFLLTIITAFFIYDSILSIRFSPWVNGFLTALASFPLVLQGLWCVKLEEKLTLSLLFSSLAASLVIGELSLAFSFWPLSVAAGSLSLTTAMYTILGLAQHDLGGRLFRRTINEYLSVALAVSVIIILTTHWGG